MKYTEKEHAGIMIEFMENYDACKPFRQCPTSSIKQWGCEICPKFVGVPDGYQCPCNRWGCEEAFKRTWLALEEKGYI